MNTTYSQIIWSGDKLVVPMPLEGSVLIEGMNTMITPISSAVYYCKLLRDKAPVTTCKECLKNHISDPVQVKMSMAKSSGGTKCSYVYNVTVVCNGNNGHLNNHAGSCRYELVFQTK